jgi:hypothetical protein
MRRKRQDNSSHDNSHYGKAASESAKLLDAQERLKGELSSNTRTRLNRVKCEASAKLKELEALDRPMTLVLAAYCRRHDGKVVADGRTTEWVPRT